jgi:uncharacterized small protein (DUF1192 family)
MPPKEGPVIDTDDLEPPKKKPGEPDFEEMGIEELNDAIAELEATIERIRAVIARKSAHRGAVESVFKS